MDCTFPVKKTKSKAKSTSSLAPKSASPLTTAKAEASRYLGKRRVIKSVVDGHLGEALTTATLPAEMAPIKGVRVYCRKGKD